MASTQPSVCIHRCNASSRAGRKRNFSTAGQEDVEQSKICLIRLKLLLRHNYALGEDGLRLRVICSISSLHIFAVVGLEHRITPAAAVASHNRFRLSSRHSFSVPSTLGPVCVRKPVDIKPAEQSQVAMKLDVNALRYLSREDFRVLTAVEMGQKNVRALRWLGWSIFAMMLDTLQCILIWALHSCWGRTQHDL